MDRAERGERGSVAEKNCLTIIPNMGGVAVYSAPGKYEFFNENDVARDEVLGLEVSVSEIFM